MIPIAAPKRTFSSYYYHVCRYKRDSRRLGDWGIQFERSLVSCRKMNGLIIPEGRDWCIWRNATVTLSSRCHASRIHLFPVILVLCHRQQNSSSNTQCSFDGHMDGYTPPLFVGLQVNTEKTHIKSYTNKFCEENDQSTWRIGRSSLCSLVSDLNHEQGHKINVASSRYIGAYSQRTQPFGSLHIKQWYRVFAPGYLHWAGGVHLPSY